MPDHKDLILTQSEYEALLKEIADLKERLTRLTALRDDLVYHICPSLRSEYEEKIACLERELLAAQLYLREMQRIIEILQAQMNQGQEPSVREAEEQAQEEYQEYQEDLNRKAKEAEEEKNRWKKESNWYEYDEGYSKREEDPYGEDPGDSEKADDVSGSHKSTSGSGDSGKQDKDKSDSDQDPEDNGHSQGGDGDHDRDDHSENAYDGDPDSGHGGKQSKASELKRLYRKIVKLLHPDVHPNPTPKEKELLNRAIQAYDRGDLDAMREIWEELTGSGSVQEEETFDDSPDGITKMKETLEKLRKRCKELGAEIRQIRSSYPYTMKAFLDDEEAVERKRTELQEQIDRTRETNRQMEEYINELKRQMGNR